MGNHRLLILHTLSNNCPKYHIIALLWVISLLVSACTHFLPTPLTNPVIQKSVTEIPYTAEDIIESLDDQNHTLQTYKGIGKLQLRDSGMTRSFRMAWAGLRPDKLRIEILDISGKPTVSFSNDGKYFYFRSYVESQFKKIKSSDANLRQLISLPIRFSDVQAFMSGRVPLRSYHLSAIAAAGDVKDRQGSVIILKKWWGAVVQKIFIDLTTGQVFKVVFFNNNGSLDYIADINNVRKIKGYIIPRSMSFSDDTDRAVYMVLEKLWVDVHVQPSIFFLPKP